ncbi:MAG: hypothetical protein V4754_16705 [Pseudomonadota bacterium]
MSRISQLTSQLSRRLGGPLDAPTLCLHLAPTRLSWALRRRGRMLAEGAGQLVIDNADAGWPQALAALRAWLAQADRPGAGLPLALALASRWCHTMVAPWSDAMLTPAGASRFLGTQMAALYGEAARGWAVTSDDAPYGQPRLACGIDATLLHGLEAAARAHGHRWRAIEPVLSVAWRALAPERPRAFAIVEAGRLLMGAAQGDRIVALHTQPCPAHWELELAPAWQRWSLRAPQLADIGQVRLLDLSDGAAGPPPAMFVPGGPPAGPLAALGGGYAALAMMGQSAWA